MALQQRLGFLPEDATIVNDNCAYSSDSERVVFYNAAGPIYSFRHGDKAGKRVAQAVLPELGIAGPTELGQALEVDQSTVHRNRKKYRKGGVQALEDEARVRNPYKMDESKRAQAQDLLHGGATNSEVASEVGVSEGTIRYALKKGWLKRRKRRSRGREQQSKTPRERTEQDSQCNQGIAVKRAEERVLAAMGKLDEAKPKLEAAEAVPNAGVLVALCDVQEQGVLEVGEGIYGRLRNGFFGLRSMLLTLVFMALLRIKNPEQLASKAPGELGLLLGLDRAPEMKTVRRKVREIGERGLAKEFAAKLAKRWAKTDPETLGYLYVDGHVRPYNGRKHKLPKTFVQRRRLCMPATTDVWVNDENAEPVFYVTAPANDGLLSMMDERVLPEVRKLVGEKRRVTMVFDREGWSPETFRRWYLMDFDVLTYRKGTYEAWPEECFSDVEVEVSGKKVIYRLGQRSIKLIKKKRNRKGEVVCPAFWMREVRRLCENGHQTSVMTTRQDLPIEDVALRMFGRWRQENFFRYMRHEFALDHLPTYSVEGADPDRLVPNPKIKEKEKALEKVKRDLSKLEREYGKRALENPEAKRRTARGFKIANGKLGKKIRQLKERHDLLTAEKNALPKRVPLREVQEEASIVRLEKDRKTFTDAIKMAAYRAETSLLNLAELFFKRNQDEGRAFLKSVFQATGDLLPNEAEGTLTVRLYSMANPRSNRVLRTLCTILNAQDVRFPGTDLRLIYEAC